MLSADRSNEKTFQRFYNKPSEEEFNFGNSVLQCHTNASGKWSIGFICERYLVCLILQSVGFNVKYLTMIRRRRSDYR